MTENVELDPLVKAFEQVSRRAVETPLIVGPRETVTAGKIDALAGAMARKITAAGLRPGSTVGLIAPGGAGFLALFLALLRLRMWPALLDLHSTEIEAHRALERLGGAGLVKTTARWPRDMSEIEIVRTTGAPREQDACSRGAVIKMTSGSTGEPTGILATTAALLADDAALTTSMGITASDRLLAAIPFGHSYGLSSLVVPCLAKGTTLIIPDGPPDAFAPLKAAEIGGATVFPTVPAYLAGLLRLSEPPRFPASLRLIISAGARLSAETAIRFRELHGQPVHVFYGASECGGITYDRNGEAAEHSSVGEPVDGVRIDLEPVDEKGSEGAGRVTVSSPAVATAYIPDGGSQLRAGRFVSNDLARWVGGELALLGRLDNVVNIKGKKINPAEVENVIGKLSTVREVKVLGVARGDADRQVLCAVVAGAAGALTAEEVRAWCREHLSEHKVPRCVVLTNELPHNERGKVDLAAVQALVAPRITGH